MSQASLPPETDRVRRRPVQEAAEALREMVFAAEPDTLIGSLPDLARALGVGIVTVQQAARILEHEGLLVVRRGPGGGYYGARPDVATLERMLSSFMRSRPASYDEALDMTSLLFTELAAAAADCADEALHDELRALLPRIAPEAADDERLVFEEAFQELLFRMVDRPLFEVLTRVTLGASAGRRQATVIRGWPWAGDWWEGRSRIIEAILRRDRDLARFEADRYNRRYVLAMLRGG